MLEVQNLSYSTKTFSMENVSFSLDDGYLMTLLGRNGAGKTTLFDLVYGRIEPLSGKVLWNDIDVTGMKAIDILYHDEVAYVGGRSWCIGGIRADENIRLLSCLYSRWDQKHFDEMLEMMEFTKEEYTTNLRSFQQENRCSSNWLLLWQGTQSFCILDEPMANLDPVVKRTSGSFDPNNRKRNISIIISTHLVEEVNDITDYIGLLDNGRLVKFGDREQILNDDLGNKNKNLRELLEEENG